MKRPTPCTTKWYFRDPNIQKIALQQNCYTTKWRIRDPLFDKKRGWG